MSIGPPLFYSCVPDPASALRRAAIRGDAPLASHIVMEAGARGDTIPLADADVSFVRHQRAQLSLHQCTEQCIYRAPTAVQRARCQLASGSHVSPVAHKDGEWTDKCISTVLTKCSCAEAAYTGGPCCAGWTRRPIVRENAPVVIRNANCAIYFPFS